MTPADPAQDSLVISSETTATGASVAVAGELTVSTRDKLASVLVRFVEDGHAAIDLDLGGVTFMDSQGLWALMRAKERSAGGTQLRIVEASKPVRRLLQLTTLDAEFGLDTA
jgi:anti-anti-sigma factor